MSAQQFLKKSHSVLMGVGVLSLCVQGGGIVVFAPWGQAAPLISVVCLIVVADETHCGRVVRKLDEEVEGVWQCAIVGQQSEQKGTQHTPLGGFEI